MPSLAPPRLPTIGRLFLATCRRIPRQSGDDFSDNAAFRDSFRRSADFIDGHQHSICCRSVADRSASSAVVSIPGVAGCATAMIDILATRHLAKAG